MTLGLFRLRKQLAFTPFSSLACTLGSKMSRNRTPLLIAEGYRPGNFKPSFATVAAIEKVMRSRGVPIPAGPKPKKTNY